jgi:hydrogenase maturation factor HypF (carbamoyltransferase family)
MCSKAVGKYPNPEKRRHMAQTNCTTSAGFEKKLA